MLCKLSRITHSVLVPPSGSKREQLDLHIRDFVANWSHIYKCLYMDRTRCPVSAFTAISIAARFKAIALFRSTWQDDIDPVVGCLSGGFSQV